MIWSSFSDTTILQYYITTYVLYFHKHNIPTHKTFISKLPMQSNMCQLLNLWEIVCWLVYYLLSEIELWILLSCNRIFAILIVSVHMTNENVTATKKFFSRHYLSARKLWSKSPFSDDSLGKSVCPHQFLEREGQNYSRRTVAHFFLLKVLH